MSNLPLTVQDDQPPLLRFVNDSMEDRFMTEKEGRVMYKDVIKVYVRAAGDTKSETPFIAKDSMWVVEGDKAPEKKVIYPWKSQLDEKLRNNQCTQKFYNSCIERFEHFEKNGEVLVEGTPISGWNQLTSAEQKNIMNAQILSIEDLAEATEEALSEIGMGGRKLKEKAKAFLRSTNKDAETIAAQEQKLAEQADQLSALQKKMAELEEKSTKPKKTEPKEA